MVHMIYIFTITQLDLELMRKYSSFVHIVIANKVLRDSVLFRACCNDLLIGFAFLYLEPEF